MGLSEKFIKSIHQCFDSEALEGNSDWIDIYCDQLVPEEDPTVASFEAVGSNITRCHKLQQALADYENDAVGLKEIFWSNQVRRVGRNKIEEQPYQGRTDC